MNRNNVQEAIASLTEHIQFVNSRYSNWYIGNCADAEKYLYDEYMQTDIFHNFIYLECEDVFQANEVVQYFASLGCEIDLNHENENAVDVYAKTKY